jgi:syntaxin 16
LTEHNSLTGAKSGLGPVIEMASTSLLNPNRSYAPVSTEDPGNSRYFSSSLSLTAIEMLEIW